MTDTQLAYRRPPGSDQPVTIESAAETLVRLQSLQRGHSDVMGLSQPIGRPACFVNDDIHTRPDLR